MPQDGNAVALQHADLIEELIVIDMALVLYQEPFLDYIKAMQEALERREAEDRNRRGARLGGARCRHPTVPNAEPGGAHRQARGGGSTLMRSPRTWIACSDFPTSQPTNTTAGLCLSAAPAPTTSGIPTTARSYQNALAGGVRDDRRRRPLPARRAAGAIASRITGFLESAYA